MEQIGRYRVIRQLGQGGMGAVYLCEDPTLEREVAIKLLLRDPSNVGLRQEAKALAALNHKGIVTIHEVGDHEGQDFLVMEYLPGKTLRELLVAGDTPRMTLLEICSRVAEAVAAAHRAGILHRDIKPENILITEDEVKVLDFGIARRLTERERTSATDITERLATAIDPTQTGDTLVTAATHTIFGTPAYMAPEILQGRPSSAASDIYSLGIVVYECVAGRRPHDPKTLAELISQVVDAEPARLDDPHGELISEMLAADPSRRPDLVEVSSQLAIGRTLIPRSATPLPVPKRRRWWMVAILGGLAVVAGVVAVWIATPEPPPPIVAPRPATRTLGIGPLKIDRGLYGAETPKPESLAGPLVEVLDRAAPTTLRAVRVDDVKAAKHVDYTAAISLHRVNARLYASVELVEVGGVTQKFDVTAADLPIESIRITPLYEALAKQLVEKLSPGTIYVRTRDVEAAQRYYREGKKLLDETNFSAARASLENAVRSDEDMFEAWFALAFVLVWQSDDQHAAIAKHALSIARTGFEREVMRGVVEYMEGNYQAARKIFEPLLETTEGESLRRDLLYFIGETYWHDGFFTKGEQLFREGFDLDRSFKPFLIHMGQHAIAHREVERAGLYIPVSSQDYDNVDFAAGRYERLVERGAPTSQLAAREVLRIDNRVLVERDGVLTPLDGETYWIADALRSGDHAVASRRFERVASTAYDKPPMTVHATFSLAILVEVLVVAEVDEARRALSLLAPYRSKGTLRHELQRLSIAAAGALRDRALLVAADTHRNRRLHVAIAAELANDRTKAVAVLREILSEPSHHMDFLERAALIRNLRSLGKTREAAEQCREILKPVAWRQAHMVLQRICR